MANIVRKHYKFYGYVQGVGFRYRAYHAAQNTGITGWVKNCSDGSVEMQAQGTVEMLSDFLDIIENGHFIQIDRCIANDIPLSQEHSFRIL